MVGVLAPESFLLPGEVVALRGARDAAVAHSRFGAFLAGDASVGGQVSPERLFDVCAEVEALAGFAEADGCNLARVGPQPERGRRDAEGGSHGSSGDIFFVFLLIVAGSFHARSSSANNPRAFEHFASLVLLIGDNWCSAFAFLYSDDFFRMR